MESFIMKSNYLSVSKIYNFAVKITSLVRRKYLPISSVNKNGWQNFLLAVRYTLKNHD